MDDFTAAKAHFTALEQVGIDFTDVTDTLEHEGLTKFEDSWTELGESVAREMRAETDAADAGAGRGGDSENAKFLAIYLNDHCAAATGGLELFRRAADARAEERDGRALADLAHQVDEDRDALARIMTALEVPTSQSKAAMGWLAEKAGRLKTNGHLLSRSPLSDVLEAESMLMGVQGKVACWRTLRALAETDERLSAEDLDVLLERAEQQSSTLEELRSAAAARTMGSRPPASR